MCEGGCTYVMLFSVCTDFPEACLIWVQMVSYMLMMDLIQPVNSLKCCCPKQTKYIIWAHVPPICFPDRTYVFCHTGSGSANSVLMLYIHETPDVISVSMFSLGLQIVSVKKVYCRIHESCRLVMLSPVGTWCNQLSGSQVKEGKEATEGEVSGCFQLLESSVMRKGWRRKEWKWN